MALMNMIEGASEIVSSPTDTCLIIAGAVHGNEPAGVLAIEKVKELVQSGDWKVDCAVYGLIGNPDALKKSVRFIDENLNRAFNGHVSNAVEGTRAQEITAWLKELSTLYKKIYLLDLHSVSIGDVRMILFDPEYAGNEEWTKRISPIPFRLGAPAGTIPGSLMSAVNKLGGCGVVVECGNHSSETGATVGLEHVENTLLSLDLLRESKTSFKGKVVYEGKPRTYVIFDIIRTAPGFVFTVPDVRSEVFVKQGDVYARDNNGDIRAPQDCYLTMPSKYPQPEDFDAGFLAVRSA